MRWRARSRYILPEPSVNRPNGGADAVERMRRAPDPPTRRIYYRLVKRLEHFDDVQDSRLVRHPRRSMTRFAAVLATSLGVAAGTAGCGNGGAANFPPKVTTSLVFESEIPFTDLERFRTLTTDFTVPAGTLQITVDWASATDDLDLVLSNPACDALAFAAGLCKILASERTNVKPARVTMTTTATAYRLFVVNMGPQAESGTVTVKVTQARLSL